MITVIGIPFGVACWKMIPLALVPLGREIVPIAGASGRNRRAEVTGLAPCERVRGIPDADCRRVLLH